MEFHQDHRSQKYVQHSNLNFAYLEKRNSWTCFVLIMSHQQESFCDFQATLLFLKIKKNCIPIIFNTFVVFTFDNKKYDLISFQFQLILAKYTYFFGFIILV